MTSRRRCPSVCHLANNRGRRPRGLTSAPWRTASTAEVTIRHVRYANEATGWAVLDAAGADGTPVALVGPLVHLEERERARVVGTWVQDSRYGRQVKVSEARPLAPEDPQTLIGYLRRVKHVGAKRAAELVARFGPGAVLDAIDDDPAGAFAASGCARRAEEAAGHGRRSASPGGCT